MGVCARKIKRAMADGKHLDVEVVFLQFWPGLVPGHHGAIDQHPF